MPLAICATPIGNLDDVTLRVLDELRAADLVLCEDTRRTRILLDRHGIDARLESHHRHNEASRTPRVLERLREGERIALVSDAGLPGVNDPGARLIAAAAAAGVEVTVLPGASAVETALVASGLGADRYQFVGYLPRRAGELRALAEPLGGWSGAVVAFESPRRLPASLRALAEALPGRPAAVCRELTKRFEEVVRGSLEELAARFAEAPRGEITLVLGPAATMVSARVDEDAARGGVGSRRSRRVAARGGGGGGAPDRHVPKRPLSRLSVTRQSIALPSRNPLATVAPCSRTGQRAGWSALSSRSRGRSSPARPPGRGRGPLTVTCCAATRSEETSTPPGSIAASTLQ